MSQLTRSAAVFGCALAIALGFGASAATVTPHVFEGGITLVDLAHENLHPWGFYDGTKGMPVPAPTSGNQTATPGTSTGPLPDGWIAAAGWSGPRDGAHPIGTPLFAPWPEPSGAGAPRASGPCFWGDPRYGSIGSRDRCGHPAAGPATASAVPLGAGFPRPLFVIGTPGSATPNTPKPGPVPVPLPATAWLLGAALASCLLRRRG